MKKLIEKLKNFWGKGKLQKGIVIVVVLMIIGLAAGGGDKDKKTSNQSKTKDTKITLQEELAKKYKVDVSIINSLFNACDAIGMKTDDMNIKKFENNDTNSMVSIEYEDYLFNVVITSDANVTGFSSGTIEFYKDGQAIQQVKDRILTSEEKATLKYQVEKDVKANLKAPSTAEFPGKIMEADEWVINKNGTVYTVSSWVDAENSFGAQIRSNFIVTYNWDGNPDVNPTVTNVTIN